jgi:mRNA-degrading endonuclease toxin of MazEF toxin-antitoxin module
MSSDFPPKQWDIWFATLREGTKGEQTGPHNVLVLSSPRVQRASGVVVVAPITSTPREAPWIVKIEPQDGGIELVSYIECHQLQALSPAPARFRTFRKRLSPEKRSEVTLALQSVFHGALPESG